MGFRTTIAVVITLAVISTIAGVYYSMSSTIKDQELQIKDLKLDVADREVKLQLEKANVIHLEEQISKQNQYIESYKVDTDKKLQEYNNWKQQEDKYNKNQFTGKIDFEKLRKGDCGEALKYMDYLKGLKYEDL